MRRIGLEGARHISSHPSRIAQAKIEAWRLDYNQHRPHSSLGQLTPNEFDAQRQITRTEKGALLSL